METTTNKGENPSLPPPDTPEGKYREALLNAATKAANLLGELMELSLIPDPRAKEAAEIALK